MNRLGSFVLCATLGTGLLACSSSSDSSAPDSSSRDTSPSKDPLELVPLDNDVSGWTVDRVHAKDPNARAMTGTTVKEVEALIDGGADPFFMEPYKPKMFLWQNYMSSSVAAAPDGATLAIFILQMPSADQASGLYTALLDISEYARKSGTPDDWQPTSPILGDGSRIQDTGTSWWINFHKGEFYVEVIMDPSYGPPPDYKIGDPDLKKECYRFAEALASKI